MLSKVSPLQLLVQDDCSTKVDSKLTVIIPAVRLYDPANGQGFGALDYFDLEQEGTDPTDASKMGAASVAPAQKKHLGNQRGEQHQPREYQSYEHQPLADHELIEKWWCIGDNRNRSAVWVQGKLVWASP